jgi:hypothetical protein
VGADLHDRIEQAIAMQNAGDREGARRSFAELWTELGPAGDAICCCRAAHHMADLQDDPREELAWDLRALSAAGRIGEEENVAAFYPSLHLNLGEDYRRLEDPEKARFHLEQAREAASVLPESEYGRTIRGAIERLAERVRESPTTLRAPSGSDDTGGHCE